jgi:hypothetical protein
LHARKVGFRVTELPEKNNLNRTALPFGLSLENSGTYLADQKRVIRSTACPAGRSTKSHFHVLLWPSVATAVAHSQESENSIWLVFNTLQFLHAWRPGGVL